MRRLKGPGIDTPADLFLVKLPPTGIDAISKDEAGQGIGEGAN